MCLTRLLSITVLVFGMITSAHAGKLATAPLAMGAGGLMECTAVNVSSRNIDVTLKLFFHFRLAPPLPNDGFVAANDTQALAPGQATAVSGTVGSDPAIGRCMFEFAGRKSKIRGAAALLDGAPNEDALVAVTAQ